MMIRFTELSLFPSAQYDIEPQGMMKRQQLPCSFFSMSRASHGQQVVPSVVRSTHQIFKEKQLSRFRDERENVRIFRERKRGDGVVFSEGGQYLRHFNFYAFPCRNRSVCDFLCCAFFILSLYRAVRKIFNQKIPPKTTSSLG